MSQFRNILVTGAMALAAAGAFAQATPGADARQNAQQQRIDAGVNSGRLTTTEANRMQRQQNIAGKVESNAKADGTVTPAERAKVNHVERRTSRNIHRQKTDAQRN